MRLILHALFLVLLLQACVSPVEDSNYPQGTVQAYKPVYAEDFRSLPISQTGPKEIESPGKIYYKDGYLFLIELNEGIHILDNRNPSNPINLDFLEIPGVKDMAIKQNYLYADSYTDLLVFDLAKAPDLPLLTRQENFLESDLADIPPERGVYFECPDPDKGQVLYWELTDVKAPKCRN